MDYAPGVGVLEGAGDVGGDPRRPLDRERTALGREQGLDVAAGHVLADDEGVPALHARVEDADDVRVVPELPHRLRLAVGARLDRGCHALCVEQGHSDLAAGRGVVGQVDALASPLPEERPDPVAAVGQRGGNVGGQHLRRRLFGLGLGSRELGPAGIAEPGALTVLIPAGRAAHTPILSRTEIPGRDLRHRHGYLDLINGERVALLDVAGVEALAEPGAALLGGAVREASRGRSGPGSAPGCGRRRPPRRP